MKWERKRKRIQYVDHFEQEGPLIREARLRKEFAKKWNEKKR